MFHSDLWKHLVKFRSELVVLQEKATMNVPPCWRDRPHDLMADDRHGGTRVWEAASHFGRF